MRGCKPERGHALVLSCFLEFYPGGWLQEQIEDLLRESASRAQGSAVENYKGRAPVLAGEGRDAAGTEPRLEGP